MLVRYLSATYEKYHTFLDGSASLDIEKFLKSSEQEELSQFAKVGFHTHTHTHTYMPSPPHTPITHSHTHTQMIKHLRKQADELYLLRRDVYLNFLVVECSEVNKELTERANTLADRLVAFMVDRNRELNKE